MHLILFSVWQEMSGDKKVDAGKRIRTITDSHERKLAFRPDTGTVA